jgi:hypothetical protein
MRLFILSFFVLALTACSDEAAETLPDDGVPEASGEDVAETPDAFICYPESIAELIGQPAFTLDDHPDRPANVRLIGPETLVTQEYLPNRLNVRLDGNGKIIGLNCG